MSELLTVEPGSGLETWEEHPYSVEPLPYDGEDGACAAFERTYRRVALCGGVYNNAHALRAFIDDAGARGAELALCLGDLGGFGPHPQRIVPLLRQAAVPTLAGNYDQAIAAGAEDCGCGYTDPMDNYYAQISYAYTLAKTPDEQRAWMGRLPLQARLRVGDRTVHCCHGSPRRTNEFLWESGTPDALLGRFLDDCDADALAFTHTGVKWSRSLSRPSAAGRQGLAINVGVLGRPENDGTTRVWYALLTVAGDGLDVEFVPLGYDHQALAEEMRAEGLPEEFFETVLEGWWTTCLEVLPAKERAHGRH